jgi:hypothetical protein
MLLPISYVSQVLVEAVTYSLFCLHRNPLIRPQPRSRSQQTCQIDVHLLDQLSVQGIQEANSQSRESLKLNGAGACIFPALVFGVFEGSEDNIKLTSGSVSVLGR